MRISDWSSDVCSSDLLRAVGHVLFGGNAVPQSIQDFREQRLLAWEVVVHRAFGHTGRRRDLVHAGDLETAATKFGNRGLEDGFAFSLGEALQRYGHGYSP